MCSLVQHSKLKIPKGKIRCKKFWHHACQWCSFCVNYTRMSWPHWPLKIWCWICIQKPTQNEFFLEKNTFFTLLHIPFLEKRRRCSTKCIESSQNNGFYNQCAACIWTKKTLPAVDENTLLCAFMRGRIKPEVRADEGSEQCWCCCCCCCCCWLFGCWLLVVAVVVVFVVVGSGVGLCRIRNASKTQLFTLFSASMSFFLLAPAAFSERTHVF